MDLELRDIPERPLIFFVFIAIILHAITGFGVYFYLQTNAGQKIMGLPEFSDSSLETIGRSQPNDNIYDVLSEEEENDERDLSDVLTTDNSEIAGQNQQEEAQKNFGIIPPFEKSGLNVNRLSESTFIHGGSGLLFADEVDIPSVENRAVQTRDVVEPSIEREFRLSNLPSEFRDRQWNLVLRVKVDERGYPVGRIRVIKSTGNAVLDQIIISRVEGSSFIAAHYEGTENYFNYTFNLEINIK